MNVKDHYDKLYLDSLQKIKTGNYETDNLIDSPGDNRFGVTLLIRPDDNVKKEIQQFLNKLRVVEPLQYYYPGTDIHVTVMSIISCYQGFTLQNIAVEEYVKVIQKSIQGFTNFTIEYKGLTASPSCLMVQGFWNNDSLNLIRDNLRKNFGQSDLQQTIDKRYAIQTAHSTVMRLKKELTRKSEFLKLIEEYRNYSFGTYTVNTLELVFNDWYQRKDYVKELYSFSLS